MKEYGNFIVSDTVLEAARTVVEELRKAVKEPIRPTELIIHIGYDEDGIVVEVDVVPKSSKDS